MLVFPEGYFEDEIRDGFYVSSIMKKCWAAQLEVLQDIDRVCRRYNINWYADCGSLLGAVRHGGFIPWDDDLDICMFRDDYYRFLQVAPKELRNMWPDYDILNYHNEEYWEPISRVINAHDIKFDMPRMEKFHGYPLSVGIDVFPLDFICPDPEEEEERKNLFRMIFELADSDYAETVDDSVLESLGDAVGRKIDRSRSVKLQLYELGEMVSSLYRRDEANEVALMTYWYRHNDHKYSMKLFEKTVKLPFENIEINAPAGYDSVLKIEYGDYMRLVKSGGIHDYPHFNVQIDRLEKWMGESSPLHKKVSADVVNIKINRDYGNGNPRVQVRTKALEFVKVLENVHAQISILLNKEQYDEAHELLVQCQDVAIQIGTYIEENQGEGFVTVTYFEEYCELIYNIAENINQNNDVDEILEEQMSKIKNSIDKDIKVKKEVVFLPFSAKHWEKMEGAWRKAVEDPDANAVVIPIPYYEKYPSGQAKEQFYNVDAYPEYLHVRDYQTYDFCARQPDEIVIQYTYDDDNYVTTIDPYYYSRNLKQYTDKLTYIPYFITDEIGEGEERAYKVMDYYVISPAVVYADKVIVQSENMKEMYVKKLTEFFGEETRQLWADKIDGSTGVIDMTDVKMSKSEITMPDEWKRVIFREDGSAKKVVLYNTSISGLFEHGERMIDKLKGSFDIFKANEDNIALLWRPDPLIDATIPAMDPGLYEKYKKLVDEYKSDGFGIYDDSKDIHRILLLADAYYGDTDKLVQECRNRRMPVMIQNVDV